LEETLREIVSRIGEIAGDFSADALLSDDLRIDSFRAVEIVFEIERIFSIKVPDARYSEVQTFRDIVNLVRSLTADLTASAEPG
jgi:acyl carrier protein